VEKLTVQAFSPAAARFRLNAKSAVTEQKSIQNPGIKDIFSKEFAISAKLQPI
jgi:hypothetical protein